MAFRARKVFGTFEKQAPAPECREMIRLLRDEFYKQTYSEQNYILLRLMEVRICISGRKKVMYKVPPLGTVCRGALKKCYGFSDAKIKVLLKKLQADGVSLEEDLRGRHGNNAIKILVDLIISKDASESHYRRARTRKKYIDCNVSMRKMWRDFVAENPNFKTNRSVSRNKGPVISFSTLRKIFCEDLSDVLSFRKARVDTCQYCDQTINKINVLVSHWLTQDAEQNYRN